ncbi:MAG TPA: dihydropteroate synthase, partial [Actinomycetales bacterium]|nr:dihydropteroate synthase [Actinomycetales bacterium]
MGVLNVTPDSFSDGGVWAGTEGALARGLALVADGADLVDVGGESTRPGATRIGATEEQERILPVIGELAGRGVVVSVDTLHAATARAAVAAGAAILNDVSGGTSDPEMLPAAAELGVPIILQHSRGEPATMVDLATYGEDLVGEVIAELVERVDDAVAAGVREEAIILDPGLGFAKEGGQNWQVLAALNRFTALGFPVLVGASRKRFLKEVVPGGLDGDPLERDHATAAVSALAAAAGAWGVRVHEARASRDAVRVAAA